MIPDVVGRFSVSDLPEDLSSVEIDRADAAIRRFGKRQTLDRQWWRAFGSSATTATCSGITSIRIPGRSGDVGHIRTFATGNETDAAHLPPRWDVSNVRFRIVRAAGPLRTSATNGHRQCPERTFPLADGGRCEDRAHFVSRSDLHGLRAQFRREIDQVVD